jgi:hypothetical protein
MPLERLPKQREAHTGNKMLTTEKNLTVFGLSIVGVCREGFLVPEHNKAGYEAKAYEPSVFARPNRPSFQDLHCGKVNDFFKLHLKEVMAPEYHRAKAAVHMQRAQAANPNPVTLRSDAAASAAAKEHVDDHAAPPSAASGRATAQPERFAPPPAPRTARGVKRKAPAAGTEAAPAIEERGRYCLRADPLVVGMA